MLVLSKIARKKLIRMARKDFEDGVSMAGFIYKRMEEANDYEMAGAAVDFYCAQQKKMMVQQELEAEMNLYQISVEA